MRPRSTSESPWILSTSSSVRSPHCRRTFPLSWFHLPRSTSVFIRSSLFDCRHSRVRRVDRATPRSGLVASLLDELLETFEIAAHASARDAHGVADVLDDTFGVVLELQHDAGLV